MPNTLAIYLDETHPRANNLFYDVELSREIEKTLKIPVDIVILNHAPDRLVYRALQGLLIKDEDEEFRSDFLLLRWRYSGFSRSHKKNTGRNSKVPVDRERIIYLLGEIEKALNILKDFQKEGEKIIDELIYGKC